MSTEVVLQPLGGQPLLFRVVQKLLVVSNVSVEERVCLGKYPLKKKV